ncbi:hypothetical protein [Lysobacter sp. HA35]
MRFPALLAPFLFAVLTFATPARADEVDLGPPVPQDRLDELRGGFDINPGLSVAFGFERLVTVNGQLLVTQQIEIPDISKMTIDQATQLASITQGQTVQVGGGTSITPGMGTLVIQNALDGQTIESLTSLHATVNTLSLLHDIHFTQSLGDSLRLGGP